MNDVNDVPAPTHRQAPRRHVPACAALLAVVGLLAAGCSGSGPEQTKGAAADRMELALQPVGAPGPDPFTPSSATAESAPVQPPLPNASGRGIRTVGAATPGLYGGTNRLGSCDVERQVTLLTSDDGKSRAFAEVAGVEREKIPEFLRGLTPVVLRADTRITNHSFRDGRADGYQAVLQAGTAVLVDAHGMPRVRCACGNPLAAPLGAKGSPLLKGDQWNGYHANQVIVIEPTAQAINSLVIVNIADNTWIERKTGDDGAQDKVPRVLPPYDPAAGIPNGPATPPDPSDPCAGADPNSLARTTPPKAPSTPPSAPPPGTPSGPPPSGTASDLPGAPPAGPPGEPAAPTGPLAGPLDETAPPLDETAPPLDLPAGPVNAPAPLLGPSAALLNEKAPPLNEAAPPVNETAPPLNETAPPLNETAPPLDETAPPLDLPAGPLDETAPPLGPPAGPPGLPAAPGDPADPAAPSATPCVPGRAADGAQNTPATPQKPRADAPADVPADVPADRPGAGALPPDPFQDLPAQPAVPAQPPADPGAPLAPGDAQPHDPAVPADPFGFPDQQQAPFDSASNLESA
ncbi:DUF6777 domain-containing protein [Streptomyces sp. NPDC004667]|uniref:DUF6777 domain-containing protein n=1 Tax=Streptomyces sp. NPDC004667 TaxID=3154285 RepID=UPI0033B0F413